MKKSYVALDSKETTKREEEDEDLAMSEDFQEYVEAAREEKSRT